MAELTFTPAYKTAPFDPTEAADGGGYDGGLGSPEAMECSCGNSTMHDGFIQMALDGRFANVSLTPHPLLGELPEDGFSCCHWCFRVYRDSDTRVPEGTPVYPVGRYDETDPALLEAREAYWDNL